MQDVHAHEHVTVFKHAFKDRGNVAVCNQLSRGADRFIQSTRTIYLDAARKHLACEQTDLSPLLDNCLCRSAQLCGEFRLMNLKVESLEALHARDELGFADSDAHRSASSCIMGFISSPL